jgi:prevent-host-death family protein
MSTTVNMHEAKTHLSRLVERAMAGEEVIIAKDGTPKVRLVPVSTGGRRLGIFAGMMDVPDEGLLAPLTDEELAHWE